MPLLSSNVTMEIFVDEHAPRAFVFLKPWPKWKHETKQAINSLQRDDL